MWALFLLLGAALLLFVSGLLPQSMLIILFVLSIGLFFYSYQNKNNKAKYLSMFILGFAYASINASFVQSSVVNDEHEGKDIVVTGVIDTVPQIKKFTTRKGKEITNAKFVLHVEKAESYGEPIGYLKRIQLNWYNPKQKIKAGQRWQFITRLKKPIGFANVGGFDYERMLFSRHIGATGYVYKGYSAKLSMGSSIVAWNDVLRESIINKLNSVLPKSNFNGIIKAVATGYRSDISKQQWSGLLTSGTNHLVAISGLHIGLIAALAFFLFKSIWWAIPSLRLKVAPIYIGAIAAIIAALTYSALAGFSIPTQRAVLMVVIFMVGILFKKITRSESILALALACVILIDPLSVLMPGFWLSFAAVVIILITVRVSKQSFGWKGKMLCWIRIQCAISIGLAPLTLLFFDRVSLVAPLVNLIAVPLFSSVIVPAIFIAMMLMFLSPQLSGFLFACVQWLLEKFWVIIDFVDGVECATFSCSRSVTIAIVLILLIGTYAFYFRRWLVLGLIPILGLLIIFTGIKLQPGEFEVNFFDVGQGNAILVTTTNHQLLYDAGPSKGIDAGESVIVPYLAAKGISRIDRFVVSHADNDHAGGAKAIVDAVRVDQITVGEHLDGINFSIEHCYAGQKWNWDGVEFSFIYPFKNKKIQEGNDASCVLLVKSKYGSLLLTGDISKVVEKKLLRYYKNKQLDIDIVSVPHHGSKGSSSKRFINGTSPQYAVVSSGYRNRYKFPKQTVVNAYTKGGATLVNTADSGMITIMVGEEGILAPKQYRHESHRIWMAVQPNKDDESYLYRFLSVLN